nr:uncharacterized protein LOC129265092 [Lytechinus pictus]
MIKKCMALRMYDDNPTLSKEREQEAKNFMTLKNTEWAEKVSCEALNTMAKRKYEKVVELPLSDDLKKFSEFLQQEIEACEDLTDPTTYRVIPYVSGKRGRKVPVLIPQDCKATMDKLVAHRHEGGITKDNVYFFARPGCQTSLRASDSLQALAEEADLMKPQLIRTTKMRKYCGTVSQILNLSESQLDWLADHMGHDIRVHREFYRLNESTVELAKVAKLMIAIDEGKAGKLIGKNLDEIAEGGKQKGYRENPNPNDCLTVVERNAEEFPNPNDCLTVERDAEEFPNPNYCLTVVERDTEKIQNPNDCLTAVERNAEEFPNPNDCLTVVERDTEEFPNPNDCLTVVERDTEEFPNPKNNEAVSTLKSLGMESARDILPGESRPLRQQQLPAEELQEEKGIINLFSAVTTTRKESQSLRYCPSSGSQRT